MRRENVFEGRYDKHVLTCELGKPGDAFRAYRLAVSGDRNGSCLLIQSPEGLTIVGDWVPREPATHARNKTLAWFAAASSPGYLAEKFLAKGWQRSEAKEEMTEVLERWKADPEFEGATAEQIQDLEELVDLLDDSETLDVDFYRAAQDICQSLVDDGIPGWTYDTDEVGHLVVLQRRFSELYRAMYPPVLAEAG